MNSKKDQAPEHGNEVAITVRLPRTTAERIDALVRSRPNKIPRHSWLLEAINEKLLKEDRVEGVLEILWENHTELTEMPRYRARFFAATRQRGTPVAPLNVVGDDALERYLTQWGLESEISRGWLQKLKKDTVISIPNIFVAADKVGPFGFRIAGLGIQARLPDGTTAILYHDHPRNGPSKTKGDRVLIVGTHGNVGNVEEEATVTSNGSVLIRTKHITSRQAPGIDYSEFRHASKREAEKFLSVYRHYVPD